MSLSEGLLSERRLNEDLWTLRTLTKQEDADSACILNVASNIAETAEGCMVTSGSREAKFNYVPEGEFTE